jgi:hypothetical protein
VNEAEQLHQAFEQAIAAHTAVTAAAVEESHRISHARRLEHEAKQADNALNSPPQAGS